MGILDSVEILKYFLNLFITLLPVGLYFFTYFSSILYKEKKSIILLVGLIFNDIIGIIYNKYSGIIFEDTQPIECATTYLENGTPIYSGNYHTEIIAFISSFFYAEILTKGTFKTEWVKFITLFLMIIATIWSRFSLECEPSLQTIVFNLLFGMIRGSLFYFVVSGMLDDTYKSPLENTACNSEYSDYTCETIKDGTVIVKEPLNEEEEEEKD